MIWQRDQNIRLGHIASDICVFFTKYLYNDFDYIRLSYERHLPDHRGVIAFNMTFTNERYKTLREIFRGVRLPLAFVDLDRFEIVPALSGPVQEQQQGP